MKKHSSNAYGAVRSLVSCTKYRESISARFDGESTVVGDREIEQHLDTCADCAAWSQTARTLVAPMRMMPAPTGNLTESILRAVSATRAHPPFAALVARCGLLAIALIQAAVALPMLLTGADSMHAPEHIAHESGAWNLALAAAFLTVVIRPRFASAFLPMVGVLVVVLSVVCASDLATGHVTVARVLTHVMMLGGLGLLATLSLIGKPRPKWRLHRGAVKRVTSH
ncbi:putative anti-sigma-YlaC factor YlaD [Antricoccus suffuscus]|uniref:Putative anti-sigma-YlaC factor YlaD n=1 Tax=Antricoccus suffuscus TaxID=1629062 RepID=A0A2T0YZG7_9ACTN|nr:zf-HC2 domain-containing protein [Antricoccus suffuscus]PRZ29499.1 putative anti-sigma-YlaC factor YlaD [Antricoccus suffuscus]